MFDFMVSRLLDRPEALSSALSRVRTYSGKRMPEIEMLTGVSRSTLYKHLSKSNDAMSISDFVSICSALGVDLAVVPDRDIEAGDDPDFLLAVTTTMLSDVSNIGRSIDLLRTYFGVKTADLAECSSLSHSTICKYVRGDVVRIPVGSVLRILRCLGYKMISYPQRDDRAQIDNSGVA